MKRQFFFSLVFLVCTNPLLTWRSVAAPQGNAERQKARELWELAVAAKGGRDRLHGVRTAHRVCEASQIVRRRDYGGPANRDEALFVFPDRFWAWNDNRRNGLGLEVTVHNGERNLTWNVNDSDPNRPRKSVPDEADRYALIQFQLIYLLETAWVKPVPVTVTRRVLQQKSVYVIEARWDKYKAEYYLDEPTYLPIKVSVYQSSANGVNHEFTTGAFSDYVVVGGIKMPSRIGTYKADVTTPYISCSTELNVDYDPTIFDRPPRIEDGPYAWRPKRKSQR